MDFQVFIPPVVILILAIIAAAKREIGLSLTLLLAFALVAGYTVFQIFTSLL